MIFCSSILLVSCRKDEVIIPSYEKDFISLMLGQWTFRQFDSYYDEKQHYIISIQDSIIFNTSSSSEIISESYSLDDPAICTLPGIELVKDWTITENSEGIVLETQDLCGNSESYNIYIDNISYQRESELLGRTIPSFFIADLRLVNSSSVIIIDNLILMDKSPLADETMRIEFYVNYGDHYIYVRYP